jgi:hypothetical protein
MSNEQKLEITRIAKEFASSFKDTVGEIAGSGWLIVDPLSGYLNFIGHEHTLSQLPANDKHPQILIMTFPDGTTFIPSGSDLKAVYSRSEDWMWIDKPTKS